MRVSPSGRRFGWLEKWDVFRVYCGMGLVVGLLLATAAHAQLNPIQVENLNPGTDQWKITNPANLREIEGYASLTSVNKGGQISLHVSVATDLTHYNIEFYRMGCYPDANGNCRGGRQMEPGVPHFNLEGYLRDTPQPDQYTGLIECNWDQDPLRPPFRLVIPNTWVSGVYLARLTTLPLPGKQSYIIFVVRDESRTAADYLFQSAVTTYQAYNNWGGKSLYNDSSTENIPGQGKVRAYRVSFDRPYAVDFNRAQNVTLPEDYFIGSGDFFAWEVHMLRWLEKKGFDVTYGTNVDTHDFNLDRPNPNHVLLKVRGFLSVGHDEYWSNEMRDNIERARDNRLPGQRGPVGLGYFSGNSVWWRIRLVNRADGAPNRIIYCYKYNEGNPGQRLPPGPNEAGGDPLCSNPYPYPYDPNLLDNNCTYKWLRTNRPDYQLTGVTLVEAVADASIVVVKDTAVNWFYAGTSLAGAPQNASLPLPGLLGIEADQMCDPNNSDHPCTRYPPPNPPPMGLRKVGDSPFQGDPMCDRQNPLCYSPCPRNNQLGRWCHSHMTLYTTDPAMRAWVFAVGSMQWSWGLTTELTGEQNPRNRFSLEAEKITCNVLEKFTDVTATASRCPPVVLALTYSLTASPTTVAAGASVAVTWTAPPGRPATDWIGLYAAGAPATAYLARYYTGGATSGSVQFRPATAGAYEVRYYVGDRYWEGGRRAQITVR